MGARGGCVTKAKILKQCRKDLRELLSLEERKETLKMSVLPRAIQLTFDRIQTSKKDYFGDALAQAADLDRKIEDKIIHTLNRQHEAEDIIDAMTDGRTRSVLTLYYLCYNNSEVNGTSVKRLYKWSDVAKRLNLSERTVYMINSEAMRELS